MPPRLATKTGAASGKQEGRTRRTIAPRGRSAKRRREESKAGHKALRHRPGRLSRRGGQRRGRATASVPEVSEGGPGSICPICQEPYSRARFPVVHAPCGHVACAPCGLAWQRKRSSRTCGFCRSPVLSIAHCAQLEQLLVHRPAMGEVEESAAGASASSSGPSASSADGAKRGKTQEDRSAHGQAPMEEDAPGASAGSSCSLEDTRAEVKKGLQELSQGDLNFIPGDYRAYIVRVAAQRAVRKGDLTMLETCLRNFKARASTRLVCEVAGLWRKAPLPAISLLLAHGAKLDGHAENRPLLHAVYCGNTRMAQGLIEMKADPAKTGGGDSPLHVAVRRGRLDCVTLLLEHGVKTDLPDPAGRTPHFLAEMGWRYHEMGCPRSPCERCRERWGIRSKFMELAGGALPAPRLPQPQDPGEEDEGNETESEDSSSDWEETGSDVSDMDDWGSEDEEEDEGEEEEEEDDDEDDEE